MLELLKKISQIESENTVKVDSTGKKHLAENFQNVEGLDEGWFSKLKQRLSQIGKPADGAPAYTGIDPIVRQRMGMAPATKDEIETYTQKNMPVVKAGDGDLTSTTHAIKLDGKPGETEPMQTPVMSGGQLDVLDAALKAANVDQQSVRLKECDMMPSGNTPASINMTAASGEELGDMLHAILNLAGVKSQEPVVTTSPTDAETNVKSMITGVEDEPSDNRPLEELSPFAALAGMASRAAVGSMVGSAVKSAARPKLDDLFNDDKKEDDREYHYYKDDLTQEEYDNTPNKATDVMNLDMNDLAYDPNKGDHRPRQAGLALANPEKNLKETYNRLLKDYKTFDPKKKQNKITEGQNVYRLIPTHIPLDKSFLLYLKRVSPTLYNQLRSSESTPTVADFEEIIKQYVSKREDKVNLLKDKTDKNNAYRLKDAKLELQKAIASATILRGTVNRMKMQHAREAAIANGNDSYEIDGVVYPIYSDQPLPPRMITPKIKENSGIAMQPALGQQNLDRMIASADTVLQSSGMKRSGFDVVPNNQTGSVRGSITPDALNMVKSNLAKAKNIGVQPSPDPVPIKLPSQITNKDFDVNEESDPNTWYDDLTGKYPKTKLALDLLPPTAMATSAVDAVHNLSKGNYGAAAVDAAGLLPGVKPLAKILPRALSINNISRGRKVGKGASTVKDVGDYVDSEFPNEVKENFYDIDPADHGEYNREGEMARQDLATAADAANELRSILSSDENLPEWVQAKITKAVDYLDTTRDYMKAKDALEEAKKGLYYYVNRRKKLGIGRRKNHPKAPTAQAWKDAASTAKKK